MNKFFKLLKKEIKEVITLQAIAGMVLSVVVLMLIGNAMGGVGEKLQNKMGSAVICDKDNSTLSKACIKNLESAGMKIELIDGNEPVDLIDKASKHDGHSCVVQIPKGFEAGINSGTTQKLEVITALKSFSMMSNIDSSAANVVESINDMISSSLITNAAKGLDVEFVKLPVSTSEITVVDDKSAAINAELLSSFAMQQSLFVPIIVFLLISFATQLNAAAIANEKSDKTLETLLSAPVSRLAVLSSKMCASGLFSLLMAGAYMIGFSSYMGGMMGGMTGGAIDPSSPTAGLGGALSTLGLQMGLPQYLLLGVQLFLTLLIALAISMILGALAKDVKSAQSLSVPLMFLTMIPYFITMLLDVNQLPMVGRVLVNLIPFTHTFTATSNLLFGNMTMFFVGMAYQMIVLAVVLFIAVKIFSSDRIFTMTLDLGVGFKRNKNDSLSH